MATNNKQQKQPKQPKVISPEEIKCLNELAKAHTIQAKQALQNQITQWLQSTYKTTFENLTEEQLKAYNKKFADKQPNAAITLKMMNEALLARYKHLQGDKADNSVKYNLDKTVVAKLIKDNGLELKEVNSKFYWIQFNYTTKKKPVSTKDAAKKFDKQFQQVYFKYQQNGNKLPEQEMKALFDKLCGISKDEIGIIFGFQKTATEKGQDFDKVSKAIITNLTYNKGNKKNAKYHYAGFIHPIITAIKSEQRDFYSEADIKQKIQQSISLYQDYPNFLSTDIIAHIIAKCKNILEKVSDGYKRVEAKVTNQEEEKVAQNDESESEADNLEDDDKIIDENDQEEEKVQQPVKVDKKGKPEEVKKDEKLKPKTKKEEVIQQVEQKQDKPKKTTKKDDKKEDKKEDKKDTKNKLATSTKINKNKQQVIESDQEDKQEDPTVSDEDIQ